MLGWRGSVLCVDLASGRIRKEALDPKLARRCLGGLGLGLALAEASDREALVFATAPLTGTLAPNGGRHTVVAGRKAASISGKWGPELKCAGYDGIVFTGKAAEPVYLWVKDGAAELRPAERVWGKPVSECAGILAKETDPEAVLCSVGPAGERGVGFATIVSDNFSCAGGSGAGAAMGSKNLKAVAVRGTQGFRVADHPRFLEIATRLRTWMKDRPIAVRGSSAGPVLVADAVSWDPEPARDKPARTRACFGCSTCFSSFSSDSEPELPLQAGLLPPELQERLEEYRSVADLGLDFASLRQAASAGDDLCELARRYAQGAVPALGAPGGWAMDRGPCVAAGYAVLPRLAGAATPETAVLDSAGLCPFLAAGIEIGTIAELLCAATGIAFSSEEILEAGRRVRQESDRG